MGIKAFMFIMPEFLMIIMLIVVPVLFMIIMPLFVMMIMGGLFGLVFIFIGVSVARRRR